MKAELDKEGYITISAENELESYALRKWIEEQKEIMSKITIAFALPFDHTEKRNK
jgi:hypothetical protein